MAEGLYISTPGGKIPVEVGQVYWVTYPRLRVLRIEKIISGKPPGFREPIFAALADGCFYVGNDLFKTQAAAFKARQEEADRQRQYHEQEAQRLAQELAEFEQETPDTAA